MITSQCRGKPHWISRESIDKDSRFNHFQNTCKFSNFHPRRKICRMGHRKWLPGNNQGTVIICENAYQARFYRHYCTLKIKWTIWSIWMDIHGNYRRNIWTPTRGNHQKQFTHTTLRQPRILPGQIYAKIMVTCVENCLIKIGDRQFWNGLCKTWAHRSYNGYIENLLWKTTTDWEGKVYCGITMKWDYIKGV